jgi:hypothetical protein
VHTVQNRESYLGAFVLWCGDCPQFCVIGPAPRGRSGSVGGQRRAEQ